MSNELTVIAAPHALRDDVVSVKVHEGLTIQEILGTGARAQVSVWLNGVPVERSLWKSVRPKAGTVLNVKALPAGGEKGNKILRTVLQIVVIAVSFVLFPGTTFAQIAMRATTAVIGMLIINALIPPQVPEMNSPDSSFDRRLSITGTRNQVNPYGAVPRVYGKHRIFPPYAALPYTELQGENQYLRLLLNLGYGPMSVTDLKIGDTALANFEDVEYEIGEAPSLFTDSVNEEALALAMDVNAAEWTRTTTVDTDEISIDIVFPQGLFSVDEKTGKTRYAVVYFEIQYRAVGSGTWLFATQLDSFMLSSGFSVKSSGVPSNFIIVKAGLRETRRIGARWKVSKGQYDVRVARTATYKAPDNPGGQADIQVLDVAADEAVFSDSTWLTLRSIEYTLPSTVPGTVLLAARIKATDQLNGVVDRLNMVVESLLEAWNGSAWVLGSPGDAQNRNPAWAYIDVFTGSATPRPMNRDTRFQLDDIVAWANDCNLRGYTYDFVVDASTTLFELAREIASIGRATFGNRDGKYTVVRELAQTVPRQFINPRNSSAYSVSRMFADEVHGIRAQFVNPDAGYQKDEMVVYDRGYDVNNATALEVMEFRGATGYNHVWDLARYHLAVLRLRQLVHACTMDAENIVATRGDMVQLSNDVIDVGTGFGRVKSVGVASGGFYTVTLDSPISMSDGASYRIRFRTEDNEVFLVDVATVPGTTDEVEVPDSIVVAAGDLFTFGIAGNEKLDLVISRIEPEEDFSAALSFVGYDVAIVDAGQLWRNFAAADVNTGTERITIDSSLLDNGDAVTFSTDGALPGGISGSELYFVINKDATSIQISATKGGAALDITSQGTGTHTLRRVSEVFNTKASITIDVGLIQCPPPVLVNAQSGDSVATYTDARSGLGRVEIGVLER